MLSQKRNDACCAACGDGSKMLVSAAVESEKMWNSLMSGVPSIVSRTSLDACDNAIISASWFPALFAKGTLCLNRILPAWMPVTAQPAARSVFDPSVTTTKVLCPCLVLSHTRCCAMSDLLSDFGQASGLI